MSCSTPVSVSRSATCKLTVLCCTDAAQQQDHPRQLERIASRLVFTYRGVVIGRHGGVWHQLGRPASRQTNIAGNNGFVCVNCLHTGSWPNQQQLLQCLYELRLSAAGVLTAVPRYNL